MIMKFKSARGETDEMYVVYNVNNYPVKEIRRTDRPIFTNISVDENWDKLTTFDVSKELENRFENVFGYSDLGLCAYIAQCIVNPMWEAKVETKTNVCDMTMIFGYDFELHNGKIITSEEIWYTLFPYVVICNWYEDENGEPQRFDVKLNVE